MTNDQIASLLQQAQQLRQDGRPRQAADAFTQAGILLLQLPRLGDAVEAFRRAIEVHPQQGLARSYLALTSWEQDKFDEAKTHALHALEWRPRCAKSHEALGLVAFSRHDMNTCVTELKKALEIEPDLMPARNYMSIALGRLGQHEESLKHCERTLILHPNNPHAHFKRATSLLAEEQYREGWLEYEWRFHTGQVARPQIPRPRWDGSSLNGRSVLVHTEQGKGDIFQFIRLLPLLKEMDARVILASPTALQPILSRCAGIDEFFPIDQSAAIVFELYTPLLSKVPDVTLISLQREDGIEQIQRVREQFPVMTLEGLDESGGAFEDTAAVMPQLDLVISSDTSCLHLAGALGVPTWAALSTSADWRWLRGRADSPWYPTMRLFRQPTLGDWQSVFEEICSALAQRVAG